MDEDMMRLYEAFSNYATDNLFWSLVDLNNAVFHTPLKEDAKNKLISLNKTYGTILSSIYPLDKSRDLITAMGNNNQLFIIYVENLMRDSDQTNAVKQKWKENGQQIAQILHRLNPYWRVPEWAAMIQHETDLLEAIATSLKAQNYTTFINTSPICHRLALDMSKYMCAGIVQHGQEPHPPQDNG